MARRRRIALTSAALASVLLVGGCASKRSSQCLSNEIGTVCADVDGSITFRGSDLEPGSEVVIDHPDLGSSVYPVGDDGTFDPGGTGVLSYVAGTSLTFTISATDADGEQLGGQIVVTS